MSYEFIYDDLIIYDPDEIVHYGTPRKSGRYPWGSGDNPEQRHKSFLGYVDDLRKKGLTESQIAEGMGISTTELRAKKSIAKTEARNADIAQAQRYKDKGMSNVAIGERMGLNESSVRSLLNPDTKEKNSRLENTAAMLRKEIDEKTYLDIGAGTELFLGPAGVSDTQMKVAVAMLKEEGYKQHKIKVPQLGTSHETTVIVLTKGDIEYRDVWKNQDKIRTINSYTEDGGRSFLGLETPRSIDSGRVQVRYAEQGGTDKDGVIELRRGVDDISLGGKLYAQVRIAVDDSHYLKGMAVYADDLPDGVDVRFNTNKSDKGDKLKAMKALKDDADNPFGAVVSQRHYIDSKGKKQLNSLNIVNEEGDWNEWSKSISSQVLSKQPTGLAKKQLDITAGIKRDQLDEIMSLTNPTVRKTLLDKYADEADSSAVHLKAAALPRQRTQVILPINSLKPNEIYAPNFRDGELVALVRFPHGGTFEIPELTVMNRNREANRIMKNAQDAVGINSKVAARLSGADFDGDTVLVIPNGSRSIRSSAPLAGLKDFDPQSAYRAYDGMRTIDGGTWDASKGKAVFPAGKRPSGGVKQTKMGDVSNLITDMTIGGATESELARAVRHSMVIIDAEKHSLNYVQSAKDNGISELKTKYQGASNAGASTLISRSSSTTRPDEYKPRPAGQGGPVDPKTGQRVNVPTGRGYTNAKGQWVPKKTESTKMAETQDARTLLSKNPTPIEMVYATHANKMKALANEARKASLSIKPIPYSPLAKATYKEEVGSLNAKLNRALKNAPLERQAQILANAVVAAKRQANPDMDPADVKKIKGQALAEARVRTGAGKIRVDITPAEWEAIQSGAVSASRLSKILANTDIQKVRELAMPRERPVMSDGMMARARALRANGHTQADIADALGIPVSTLTSALDL